MTKKDAALPPRVFAHGAWYRIAIARGDKREWHKLTRIKDGLPAMWRAYAAFTQGSGESSYLMPALIADWEDEVLAHRAPKTRAMQSYLLRAVSAAFAEFRPDEPQPPHCVEFLSAWADKPRSYNVYRSLLSELFRFAIEKGRRPVGTDPVRGVIRTKAEKPRQRCPTTSEIRRMKVACLNGLSGGRQNRPARTRQGLVMAALIELAYLTGQDVGRLVLLREAPGDDQDEPFLTDAGISFRRSKTGGRVVIEWSPRLRAVVAALRRAKAERLLKTGAQRTPYLLLRQDGSPMTYEAASNAWQRAMVRHVAAGGKHFMLRDIRARALTDKAERHGRVEARKMSTHTTESQLADYLRQKAPPSTKATA